MNYIVGDIGNTSTRVCLMNEKSKIIESTIFDTNRIFHKGFIKKVFKKLFKKKAKKEILFSSVVPIAFRKIKYIFRNSNYKVFEIKRYNLKKLIKMNIKNINQLGSDRIVNSIEGKKFKNCLIIDFGTATTFDVIKNETYEGGAIAPGVKLSIKTLSQSTALLPIFNLKNKKITYGKNTKDALNAGFFLGYEGLINNIVNKITLKWKMRYKIILTGGYANFFKKIIKKRSIIDQDITIKGISKVYKFFV
tara:strand:- start:1127 stop:1873 length:747 start_codon:yes stop_codon:yes gene_type:complete